MLTSYDEVGPKLVDKALSSFAKEEWKIAMEEKMKLMNANHVWDLVDLLQGCKAIENK